MAQDGAVGISIREFARRDGCSDKLVREALKTGHLSALPDGKISPDLVGTGWRKTNRHGAEEVRSLRTDESAPAGSAPGSGVPGSPPVPQRRHSSALTDGAIADLTESEKRKEHFTAARRQLQYEREAGRLVEIEAVARKVGEEYAAVRRKLTAIPAEQAPRIHRCKTPLEVQAPLTELIDQALSELTQDAAP